MQKIWDCIRGHVPASHTQGSRLIYPFTRLATPADEIPDPNRTWSLRSACACAGSTAPEGYSVWGEDTCAATHGSDGGMLTARVIVSDTITKKQTAETQFHFSWTSVQDTVGKSAM